MAVQWTEEQQKVIALRNRSILVSAAAGSGKTAVLVQRILGKLLDREHPMDIDRMLIMTFTRAAAGEMKERLGRELEKALYENPDNEHLQRQMSLIHTAQITTIDGFCAYVLRNYFHLIDLDPGYRVGDEGEMKLLKQDVLKDLLEDSYAEKGEAFHAFVETFCTGKSDEGLKDLILKLYDTAMSDPYPETWLDHCLHGFQGTEEDECLSYPWFEKLWEIGQHTLDAAENSLLEARGLCQAPEGPYLYEDAVNSDLLQLESLQQGMQAKDYERVYRQLQNLSFAALSRKKMEADERLKNQVKTLRDAAKKMLREELAEKLFASSLEELRQVMDCAYEPLTVLVQTTKEFMERFTAKKREKNILDFGDMEHLTLKILGTMDEEGNFVPSKAAREMSEKYEEVMVDEYQDSNLVQEIITRWVSGWAKDQKNIFMVGDVKQSIYRFRQAKPELFMEKYHRFTEADSEEQRIDLHKNFRSRAGVLHSVNYLFRQLMGEDLGGITYDEAAALNPGADFPEGENPEFLPTELLLIDKEDPEYEETDNAQELEALAIAQRIREMVGKETVYDREMDAYRPVEYGDIVVLLRSFSGWGETVCEVLSSQGIPVYAASRTGYFSATEVMTLLNYLRIADNPRQDIPLVGVLSSPIGACSAEELAVLRSGYPEGLLWDSVQSFLEGNKSQYDGNPEVLQSLRKKLEHFTEELKEIRRLTAYTPVHQLILEVLERTGYGRYARALPDGAQRSANLLMLVEKAMEYEKTSYRGLFNFIRYVEQLHKYEVDFGEVNLSGAGQGAVQVMTIHKSKGLEFPIVFAAGMGKRFNLQDTNAGMLVHPEMGAATDAVLPEKRLILASPYRQVLRQKLLEENLGEELRVLYVALTRAKEKLILTGTIGGVEKRLWNLLPCGERTRELLAYQIRCGAKCCWDWILPALMGHRSMEPLCQKFGILYSKNALLREDPSEFAVRLVGAEDLTIKEIAVQSEAELQKEYLTRWDPEKVWDETLREELTERFSYEYPTPWLREIPGKVSVSDLKKRSYHEESELSENILQDAEKQAMVPRFMKTEEAEQQYTGAKRGTAYHRVMECLDYRRTETAEELYSQLTELQESQRLSAAEADCVRVRDLQKFLAGSLGERMKEAALSGKLLREQPFMILRNSEELDPSWHEGVGVIVQGIIDAYFLEGEEIVLVDYKTDRVQKGQEQRLIDLYHVQLEDYACALERMTGRRVKEIYIYSFTLEKSIQLEWHSEC